MLFNSIPFLFFFPVVTVLFFLTPHKFRWSLLLAASCFFYMFFKPIYILVLVFTIIIDYFAGIYIEKAKDPSKKKLFLLASIAANIGVLVFFKYFNFINGNISGIASLFGYTNHIPYLKILLPIGLSFHTFQAMSYTIEVYRGKQKAERHFGIYSLYVMFYPQLVAGPIERPQHLLPQFHEKKFFSYENAVLGLNLIAFGLFKKMVIADRLGEYVNHVYGDVGNASTMTALIAVFFYSFQIYCDFSGYSDIARGCAKFMGYDLVFNFNRPYSSQSIAEFWKRWHISLSTWFRDYLYIPLGGNRVSKVILYRNLLIVFLISGLWHGANWTFVFWGALHAFYVITAILTKSIRTKIEAVLFPARWKALHVFINRMIVFALVSFAWIFFRAPDFHTAIGLIQKIAEFKFTLNLPQLFGDRAGPLNLILSFFVIALLLISYYIPRELKLKHSLFFLTVTTFLIITLGKDVTYEFIYFQF
jgi:alginate O-acetyltransferase complex protein AlgI